MTPISKQPAVAAGIAILSCSICFLFIFLPHVIFAQPSISSFSPVSGPVGTSVTINGSGFNATVANNLVFFGPVKASVTVATSTQLVVNVPAGAGPQPFSVTNAGLTAFAAQPFMVGIPGMDAVSAGGISKDANRGAIELYWNTMKTAIATSDLNADGKPDLLAGMDNGNLTQYNNASTPGWFSLSQVRPDVPTGASPYAVADIISGDLNGDGIAEIITAAEFNDQIAVFSNTMSQLTTLGVRGGPNSLAIADVDLDGKPDIVVGCDRNSTIRIFRNTSTGSTLSFASANINTGFMAKLAVCDLNGDGKPDIAGVLPDNNGINPVHKVGLLQNTSTGPGQVSFTFNTFVVAAKPGTIQLGDLDGDNKGDMVVTFPTTGKVTLYRNQSSGNISFDGGTDLSTTGTPGGVAVADLDADAKPEIVVGNASAPSVDVFKNNSIPGAFSFNLVNIPASFNADQVLVNDFDGDGKNDIAIGTLNTSGVAILRNIISEPVITSFTPAGTAAGGTVTIQGLYLSSATEVSFGGTPASSFVVNPDGSLTATVANGASGNIIVKTPFGKATNCCYTFYRSPTFTLFTPTAAATGAKVTITGTNFTGTTQVTFGGTPATNFSVNGSGTTITATVGAGASGTVEVVHPAGNVSKTGFTYLPPPTITSFSPTSGKAGDEIIITGTNFTNNLGQGIVTGVSLGGVAVASRSYLSNTQLKVIVGSGASGAVRVNTSSGSATLAGFTFLEPPVISAFTPASGSAGSVITITGSNFGTATAVSFGGTAVTTFTIVNDNTITATVAGGASGDVQVTTPYGTSALAGFTYFPPTIVTGFSPKVATAGQTLTITGHNFTNATSVTIGGQVTTSFTIVNDSTISLVLGVVGSGTVGVTTPAGYASVGGFVYGTITPPPPPVPVITAFAPVTAGPGERVIITGAHLENATSVTLGGMPARSFGVTGSFEIWAYVDSGRSGNVTVTTPDGTATLGGFIYRPPVYDVSLYPNPVYHHQLCRLNHPPDAGMRWLVIYDVNGKVVKSMPVPPGSLRTSIYTNDMLPGVYQVALLGAPFKGAKTLLVQ